MAWRSNPSFDFIEASHDGYAPARHRRTVVRTSQSGWLIVDAIVGSARRHAAAAHWHFDPAWRVTGSGSGVRATHADGDVAWMLCAGGTATLHRGDAQDGDAQSGGWCAPVYGQLVPTSTVHIATEAEAPFAVVTWIGSGRAFTSPIIHCTQLNEHGDPMVIVEIVDGSRSAVFLVRTSDSPLPRRVCHVGECETDATMLHYVVDDGHLRSLSVVGGQHVITANEQWLSVAADAPLADLHVAIRSGEVDVESAAPPSALTLQGTSRCIALRANGRDLPLSSKSTTDTLLIHGSDWLPFSHENSEPTRRPIPVQLLLGQ
jgi:hypothetical protein